MNYVKSTTDGFQPFPEGFD
jgi:hypothetical protein